MPRPVEDVTLTMAAETLEAKAELEKAGYKLPGRPTFDLPTLPRKIGDLSDDELMELFTAQTRWSDHIGGLLALQEVDERFADSAYDWVWAQVLSECVAGVAGRRGSESSVTVAKAEATQHPNVKMARDKKDMIYARRKVFQVMNDNLERDNFAVSRELTRRLGREPRQRRADRWNP